MRRAAFGVWGVVVGSAVVGAVLQNQLVVAMRDRAMADAAQLPAAAQQLFKEAFSRTGPLGQVDPPHGSDCCMDFHSIDLVSCTLLCPLVY